VVLNAQEMVSQLRSGIQFVFQEFDLVAGMCAAQPPATYAYGEHGHHDQREVSHGGRPPKVLPGREFERKMRPGSGPRRLREALAGELDDRPIAGQVLENVWVAGYIEYAHALPGVCAWPGGCGFWHLCNNQLPETQSPVTADCVL
jgi:hypothetical protein